MEKIISKRELEELEKIKGEVRGLSMKGHAKFVLKEEGRDALQKTEKEMQKLGYDFKYDNIKKLKFYPLSLYCIEALVIKRLFNYDNEKFTEIGEFNTRISLIVKLFMKYFISVERMAKETPKMWRKYFTVGNIELTEYDEKKRYMVLKVEDFHSIPLLCYVIKGFFPGVAQMVVGSKGTCEETKCSFRGDPYEEFVFKW